MRERREKSGLLSAQNCIFLDFDELVECDYCTSLRSVLSLCHCSW